MSERKSKSRIQVVDAWEAYTVECPECYDRMLITEPIRGGDTLTCPNCKTARIRIGRQYASCRDNDEPTELDPIALGPFV